MGPPALSSLGRVVWRTAFRSLRRCSDARRGRLAHAPTDPFLLLRRPFLVLLSLASNAEQRGLPDEHRLRHLQVRGLGRRVQHPGREVQGAAQPGGAAVLGREPVPLRASRGGEAE